MKIETPPQYLTPIEAAKKLGISSRSILNLINRGRLRALQPMGPRGGWRIPESALTELIENSTRGQA